MNEKERPPFSMVELNQIHSSCAGVIPEIESSGFLEVGHKNSRNATKAFFTDERRGKNIFAILLSGSRTNAKGLPATLKTTENVTAK